MRCLFTACLIVCAITPFAGALTITEAEDGIIRVENDYYVVQHDPKRGGTITSMTIKAGDKTFAIEMDDGMAAGGDAYMIKQDEQATIKVIRKGDTLVMLIVEGHYAHTAKPRDATPTVKYGYIYRADSPLVQIDVELPQQQAATRYERVEQFVFNLTGDKAFDALDPLVTGGDGSIMPATFKWSACEARPNAGVLYRDDTSAFAVITPTAGSFRLDAEAMHVRSRGFLSHWLGNELTSGAILYLGPTDGVEEAIAKAYRSGHRPEVRTLWRATFKDTQTGQWVGVTGRIDEQCQVDNDAMTMTWTSIDTGRGRVTAHVTGRRISENSAGMRLSIDPLDDNLSLWDVQFPVTVIEPHGGGDHLVMPYKGGAKMPNPSAAGLWELDYPGSAGWPFFVHWQDGGAGTYLGAHDPAAGVKTLRSLPTGDGNLELSFIHPAPDAGKPGNGYAMDYDIVLASFEGDWYQGAMIYRDWMVKQDWFPQKKLHENPDVPQWLKDVVVTTRRSGDPKCLTTNIELHEDSGWKEYHLGVFEEHDLFGRPPTLFWWYHAWFGRRGTDEKFYDAPEWPAPPGFAEGVKQCKERGLHVISYSLNRWWGHENESWKKKNAERAVLIRADGSPWIYNRRNVGIMCYGTQLFQQEMQYVMHMLLDQGDVDGTYFDLGGTSGGVECYSTEHGHPAGTGAWVTTEHRNLMAGMRAAGRERNDDFVVIMEGNADCYLTAVDGYAQFESSVPMRSALYADYSRTAGHKRTTWERSPLEAVNPAKHFAWGGVIGRFVSSEMIRGPKFNDKAVAYFKRLVAHKWCARPWLNLGTLERPFAVSDITPPGPRELAPDTLLPHAAWRAPDGSVAFVFANARHSTAVTFTWSAKTADYDIPTDGSWRLHQLEPSDQPPAANWTDLGAIEANLRRNETLEPGGTLILVAKPAK